MAVNPASLSKPDNPNKTANSHRWPWYIAPIGYLLLTILFTWPLLPNFFEAIPRGLPDSYQNLWNFWWVRTSLFDHLTNPNYTDLLFYPYRGSINPLPLYMHTLQPALSLPGGVLAAFFGAATSYNLIIFIGFITTAWAAYALAHYFLQGDKEVAAFLVGAFYSFSAYHQNSVALGQTEVNWAQWLPLTILFLHKTLVPESPLLLKTRTQRYFYPIITILLFCLTFLTNWYYFMYLGLYAAGLYGFLVVRRANTAYNWRTLSLRVITIGLVTLVCISPYVLGALRTVNDPDITFSGPNELVEQVAQSAPLLSLFSPERNPTRGWQPTYLGYFLLVMVGFGLWAGLRKAQPRPLRWVWWWVAVTGVCLILSLGPYLRIFSSEDAVEAMKSGLPLPYQLLQKIPFLGYGRNPARFLSVGTLGLGLLAGGGLVWLQQRLRLIPPLSRQQKLISPALLGIALILLVVDLQALPISLNQLYYPKVLEQLSRDPANSYAVFELPITTHYVRDNRRMYFQTIHHHPINSGYISRRVVQFYQEVEPIGYFFGRTPLPPESIFSKNPDAALKVLQLYNFRYLLFYRDEAPPEEIAANLAYLDKVLGKEARIFDDGITVAYRVPDSPNLVPALLVNTNGGYNAEKLPDGRVYRWAENQMQLQILSNQEVEISLSFIAWSLPPENQLEVKLNSGQLQPLKLTQSPQSYTIKVKLNKGRNYLNFGSLLPGTTPQALGLPYSDSRKLAFAIGDVQLTALSDPK